MLEIVVEEKGGLSPPTRGSHAVPCHSRHSARSIPAHAGEPSRAGSGRRWCAVYPRPRGGADEPLGCIVQIEGLSPPTRGSHSRNHGWRVAWRSIPAHAGEPAPRRGVAVVDRVYPRPRGGAVAKAEGGATVQGLSPPTRGSLRARRDVPTHRGSIPAHAGEPRPHLPARRDREVYPRPRGGADLSGPLPLCRGGLSPPTRGSHPATTPGRPRSGSIPAHAGEPSGSDVLWDVTAVYPRPRGGASVNAADPSSAVGLSPPTRGSPGQALEVPTRRRSIPAHAGEPL